MVVSTRTVKRPIDSNFRALLCDTKTGRNVINEVPMINPTWGLRLNAPGPVSIGIPMASKEAKKMDIRNATTGIMRSLGISYDNEVLECGPIWGVDYDEENEVLNLQASGLWSALSARKIIRGDQLERPGRDIIAGPPMTIGPTSIGGVMRELVRAGIEDNPYAAGTAGHLNIVLPPVETGTHTRNFNAYELRWLGETLQQLTENNGGPDLRFRPRYSPTEQTRVEWLMEQGTVDNPLLKQQGPPWRFDGTTDRSPVVGFGGGIDYRKVAARAWRPGSGQEKDMRLGVATDTTMVDLGMPWTETDAADKQEESDQVLDSRADYDLAALKKPSATISVTVRADGNPRLGRYWPGDYAQVVIPENHPIFPAGPAACRIMAIDGDDSPNVKLSLAPFAATFDGSPYAFKQVRTSGA